MHPPASLKASQSQGGLRIALIGAANTGKTTLFNTLTGSHYATVNYPGATVEYMTGASRMLPGWNAEIIDTPGLKSLSPSSPDEMVTVKALFESEHCPDLVIAVADANQLPRHLYLVHQLREVGFPVVLCVTLEDMLQRRGLHLDTRRLAEMLEVEVVALDPRRKEGLLPLAEALKRTQIKTAGQAKPNSEKHAALLKELDEDTISQLFATFQAMAEQAWVRTTPQTGNDLTEASRTDQSQPWRADAWLLHPIFGIGIFIGLMCLIFTSIFWAAAPFMDGIDSGFGFAISFIKGHFPASWITDLIADGLIGGVGAVAVFLPQIVILFFAMGYMEDSGYLARGAALMDRPLSMIGLNGKSFVPLLSGYACAIPAMMAARTIPNRRERMLTLMVIPLLACSARLPVYSLVLAFLIPPSKAWLAGLGLTALYLGGFVLSAIASTVLSRILPKGVGSHFSLELPTMRKPVFKVVLISTYHKSVAYIQKAGMTIVIIALSLWVLTHTPPPDPALLQSGQNTESGEYVALSHSYAAQIGQWIDPITRPMGLDWRGGVALMCGFAAREVFVSALALVYRVEGDEAGLAGELLHKMPELKFEDTGKPIFTIASVLGLLLFYMIALQCFPTVVVAKNEMGGWKPALFQLIGLTGGAYILAVALVQGLRFLGVP